jgi:hypothetical protein
MNDLPIYITLTRYYIATQKEEKGAEDVSYRPHNNKESLSNKKE